MAILLFVVVSVPQWARAIIIIAPWARQLSFSKERHRVLKQ